MSLIDSEVVTLVRGYAEVTIEGKTTRLSTDWSDRFMFERSYGALEQLKKDAKGIVKDYERHWGPTRATIVYHEQTKTTTVQTYSSTRSKVHSIETAGKA